MKLKLKGGDPLKFIGNTLFLGHFCDVRPLQGTLAYLDWRMNASISKLWKAKPDLLDFGRMSLFATQGKVPFNSVILVGLGKKSLFDRDLRREVYRMGLNAAEGIKARVLAVEGLPLADRLDKNVMEDLLKAAGSPGAGISSEVFLYISDSKLLPSLVTRLKTGSISSSGTVRKVSSRHRQ